MGDKATVVSKRFTVTEPAGIPRSAEWIRFSIPCARGEAAAAERFTVRSSRGGTVPCQSRALKCWPDGSVKWLLVDAAVDVAAAATTQFLLESVPSSAASAASVQIAAGEDSVVVDTGAAEFVLDRHLFHPFLRVRSGGSDRCGAGKCLLSDCAGSELVPRITDCQVEEEGVHAVVRLSGQFDGAGFAPSFSARLHFFAGSSATRIDFALHNSRAARHPGGLWDLGDPGSYLFRALHFEIPCGCAPAASCQPTPGAAAVCSDSGTLSIYQESSGGENWQSRNHRSSGGKLPLLRRGYLIRGGDGPLVEGLRAAPTLRLGTGGSAVSAAVARFWQEFPKALSAERGRLRVELFPAQFPEPHELQGGERKTHTFHLDFAASAESLCQCSAPLQVTLPDELYRSAAVFADLPAATGDLVDSFSSAAALVEKRELIDEYGWRNFGEMYADHEAVYHRGQEAFVSHYNNQYDGCAGAYRKFFASGDPLWGELAADLARHVLDIDIYHTGEDREEYNGGLFWHTDHYLDAGLASHRSFSKEQLGSRDPRFCGGGPGAEHCYTTGLMIHYFQSGDPAFKEAVLGLANWALLSLGGPQTVLASLKRGVRYLGQWKGGRGSGRLFPRFPLTRGTGNALVACLDACEVGGGMEYLEAAEQLIAGALHPDDDIGRRDLSNPELAWSYTVLLAAIGKYLGKKEELGERDAAFRHAQGSLLAYADWMVQHEYPYLAKPELLEYPNETWAAQELRKSVVLHYAARYGAPQRRDAYLRKGRQLFAAAREELQRRPTSSLLRPVLLMLQNGWVGSRLWQEGVDAPVVEPRQEFTRRGSTPGLTLPAVACRIVVELLGACRRSSPRREWAWLRARLG